MSACASETSLWVSATTDPYQGDRSKSKNSRALETEINL